MGRDVETFEACAVKLTKLDEASGGASAYENEIDILTRLTHRNVPKYYGSFRRQHVGFLILEYFPFPTLAKYLVESGSLPEDRALYVFRQLVRSAFHSHEEPKFSLSVLPLLPLCTQSANF